jgi:hypothetical protein
LEWTFPREAGKSNPFQTRYWVSGIPFAAGQTHNNYGFTGNYEKDSTTDKVPISALDKKKFNYAYISGCHVNNQNKRYHIVYYFAGATFSNGEILIFRKNPRNNDESQKRFFCFFKDLVSFQSPLLLIILIFTQWDTTTITIYIPMDTTIIPVPEIFGWLSSSIYFSRSSN